MSTPEHERSTPPSLEALHQEIAAGRTRLHRRPAGDPARHDRGRASLPARLRARAPPARPDRRHQYNYYDPEWHPYVKGREPHTLQSVTKSVTSVLIGIAIGRGEIPGVEVACARPARRSEVRRSRWAQGEDHARGPAHDARRHRVGRDAAFPTPTPETTARRWRRARTGSSSCSTSRWRPIPARCGSTRAA